MLSEYLKLGHSIVWAVALVATAWFLAPLLQPHPQAVQGNTATIATGQVQTIAERAAASEAAQIVKNALPDIKMTTGELSTALSALKPPTKTVVYATTKVVAPSPVPAPTAAPGMNKDTATFYYNTAYSADVAALHNTKIDNTLHIDQQTVALGRWSTALSSNGSAGIGYDLARRGRMNITASLVQERSIMPGLSVDYCFVGSLCGGPYVDGRGRIGVQLQAHF